MAAPRIQGYNLGVATLPILKLAWQKQLTAEYRTNECLKLLTCPRTQKIAADIPRAGFRIRDEEGR